MIRRRVCRDCGAPLESNGDQWVDERSGDVGGTFDICPARFDAQHPDGPHGHRPRPMEGFTVKQLRAAYDRGWLSQATRLDWDVALAVFSRKYCQHTGDVAMCALEHAWADGWGDHAEANKSRRPA